MLSRSLMGSGRNIPDKNSKLVLYYKKTCQNTTVKTNLDGENYYCPKNLDGKDHYYPRNTHCHKNWEVVEFPSHFFSNTILNFGQE